MPKVPQTLSIGEETFAHHCRVLDLKPEREYRFHPVRKWAFDFAFLREKIAVEVEGGTAFGKSRHSRGEGFVRDCQKYNAATLLGWRVMRYTTEMVIAGTAIDDIECMLEDEKEIL